MKSDAAETNRARLWLGLCLLTLIGCLILVTRTMDRRPAHTIRFHIERDSSVMLSIHASDGTLVRRLIKGQRLPAGTHPVNWDGRSESGAKLRSGEYGWRGLMHEGAGLKLQDWVINGGLHADDGTGVPSAVAADGEKVYLGWSLSGQGSAIKACDLGGRVLWEHRRAEGASGCQALAVDDGLLYVLGGLAGVDAEGGAVYRLNVADGKPAPWPGGQIDMKIASFWPPDAKSKPARADAMAVRHDRIYLTFTSSEFLAVLNAKTGAYLQTVVGAPPGYIDIAPTKTDLPDEPGKLVDADFAVITLGGGVLGKVLFAHDPLWVVTSELTPIESDVHITALTVLGDGAKHHRHTAFVGLGEPFHQLQARHLLDTEGFIWVAGQPGGRPLLGPWHPGALRDIRGVALAADGNLWAAEGDAFPKRFSVWNTTGTQGKLVREIFPQPGSTRVASPLDPNIVFADGGEWRLGEGLTCLGVVARERASFAAYGITVDGKVYLLTSAREDGSETRIFERAGDGDYRERVDLQEREKVRFLPGEKFVLDAK